MQALDRMLAELQHKTETYQDCFALAQEAVELASEVADQDPTRAEQVAIAQCFLAIAHHARGEYVPAIDFGSIAIEGLSEFENHDMLSRAYATVGFCCAQIGDSHRAVDIFLKLKKTGETHAMPASTANAHHGLAIVYLTLGDFDQAVEHEIASLDINLVSGTVQKQVTSFNNLCHFFIEQENYRDAIKYGLLGLEKIDQLEGSVALKGFLHINLYQAHAHLGELDSAETYLQTAVTILKPSTDSFQSAVLTYSLGEFAFFKHNYADAIRHAKAALQPIEGHLNTLVEQKANLLLYRIYRELGDFEQALQHHEQLHAVEIKRHRDDTTRKFEALLSAHRSERERREAELLFFKTIELERRVDAQTLELRSSLDRERALATTLEEALQEAEHLSIIKSKVIEVVSHEFRTPLTIINSAAMVLSRYLDKLDATVRARQFDNINNAVEQITALVSNVETASALNAAAFKPSIERTTVGSIITELQAFINGSEDIADRLRWVAQDCAQTDVVETDLEIVMRILGHLTSNALKFSEGAVLLTISAENQTLHLAMQDNGIGVEPDKAERIFEMLERGSNIGTIGGLGMGLYVSRLLSEKIGATLQVDSDGPDTGATFTLSLPLAK